MILKGHVTAPRAIVQSYKLSVKLLLKFPSSTLLLGVSEPPSNRLEPPKVAYATFLVFDDAVPSFMYMSLKSPIYRSPNTVNTI